MQSFGNECMQKHCNGKKQKKKLSRQESKVVRFRLDETVFMFILVFVIENVTFAFVFVFFNLTIDIVVVFSRANCV